MRILLVRHGETEWNRIKRFQGRSNLPLNQTGKKQIRALALALKDAPITAIYTSPLIRAMETAILIRSFHPSVPIMEDEGLMEMDLGEFDGMEAQHWIERYPNYRKTWQRAPSSVKMPGGESLQEVQTRAVEALERITKEYPPEVTLLICTHNFVICSILCHALEISLDNFREIKQETAALNIVYKKGKQFRVESVNDRAHLQ
jgi:broad specificity phosphatase PhoE